MDARQRQRYETEADSSMGGTLLLARLLANQNRPVMVANAGDQRVKAEQLSQILRSMGR